MKKIKSILLSLTVFSFALSCADENFGDDYNKDVNGIYSSDYKSLMSGAMMNFAQNGGNAYLMNPQLYVQYQSQYVYTTESLYGETASAWSRYYVNQMNSLSKIIQDYLGTVTPAMAVQGSAQNMIGVSKIFRAIVMKRVTDAFGDAPFSEAMQIQNGIKTPKYDSQQAVYTQIIKDLKDGRDALSSSTTAPQGDIIYEGNVTKWKKLANSVLLQVALQMSKKYPSATGIAATEFNAALSNSSGVIETIADEAWFTFSSSNLLPNPLNAFRAADYRLSRELVESLKGTSTSFNRTSNHTADTRLKMYNNAFSMSITGLPYGYSSQGLSAAGYSAPSSATNSQSLKFRGADSPMNLMTAGYTFLNRAEAAARGWTTENVELMLSKGIVLNYQTLDKHYITNSDNYDRNTNVWGGPNISGTTLQPTVYADAYAAARVADITAFGALRVIGEEKWVALFNNGLDSWSEWRRTGYPNLVPATNALNGGVIPRRMIYPLEEQNFNSANYKTALSGLNPGTDSNKSKIWWDQ